MQEKYPELESEIQTSLFRFVLQIADQNSPITGDIASHPIFEGDKSEMLREDGDCDEINMREFTTENIIPRKTILYGTLREVVDVFKPIGEAMASDKEKLMLDLMEVTTEKTGNIVDGRGKPLSHEMILEVFEKIQIDFDDNGVAKMPTIVASPAMEKKFEELFKGPQAAEFQKKFDALMDRKKAEWRAREADRVLVG